MIGRECIRTNPSEAATLLEAWALGGDVPTVHLHPALDDREADSETALRPIERAPVSPSAIGLRKPTNPFSSVTMTASPILASAAWRTPP